MMNGHRLSYGVDVLREHRHQTALEVITGNGVLLIRALQARHFFIHAEVKFRVVRNAKILQGALFILQGAITEIQTLQIFRNSVHHLH